MPKYWIDTQKKLVGPLTRSKLDDLASAGKLKPTHLVSMDQVKWLAAEHVEGLQFSVSGTIDPVVDLLDLTFWLSERQRKKCEGKQKQDRNLKSDILEIGIVSLVLACLTLAVSRGGFRAEWGMSFLIAGIVSALTFFLIPLFMMAEYTPRNVCLQKTRSGRIQLKMVANCYGKPRTTIVPFPRRGRIKVDKEQLGVSSAAGYSYKAFFVNEKGMKLAELCATMEAFGIEFFIDKVAEVSVFANLPVNKF